MKIQNTTFKGRKAWQLDNEAMSLTMLQGGGHIASLILHDGPRVNPFWVPVWKTMEPWQFSQKHAGRYGIKLLASICGHNLCLGWFGEPSDEETKAGLGCHGEAPVARWKQLARKTTARGMNLTCGCDLPIAGMKFARTLSTMKGSHIVSVREQITNLSRRDVPFTMCQHVTMGPPFLEKGVTVFDMPADKCHTFPDEFGPKQRLKPNTAFQWPKGPGVDGKDVNMRMIGKEYRVSSDYSAQLINTQREDAWFSAINPRLGLMIAYVWQRSDYPWVGNWEENSGRKEKPWAGKSLTRGMEFTNSPFPVGLRQAVTMGKFQRQPTFRWLPARGKVDFNYSIIAMRVPDKCTGVADIQPGKKGFGVDLIV